ncbi:LuxR C-terminal-related transcriptional regulator [Microbacterium aerolatum]|uniref:helix-turn-helix transcriptional regulator n=1 Tax=Microbacterium aerolatum TaxID=153731 RepID=UPI0020007D39|nr:LuxR family transcriptional regulator [Microbacterium aerolatum]MCK3768407.1 LuxR C-terminal-related transcriptional regulator [Microbacterium aerolatum]
MTSVWRQDPLTASRPALEGELVAEIAAELLASDLNAAPHVIGSLLRRLEGDAVTVRETCGALSPAQRAGQRMLPRLLPLVPSISACFDGLLLDPDDRLTLLVAGLSVTDNVEVLLRATGRAPDELLAGRLNELLAVSHGRFTLCDRRATIWLQHTTSALEIAHAHELLERTNRDLGDEDAALWHRASGALQRIPDAAAPLIEMALALSEAGHADRAFVVATEAAEHADGASCEWARAVAGAAAMSAGCFEDAAERLGPLSDADHALHAKALGIAVVAETNTHGMIAMIDPAEHRPRAADPGRWRDWARTASLAAVACAERGAPHEMRAWLAALREADARAGADGAVRDAAVALCWMLTGEVEAVEPSSGGPFSGTMVRALHAAVRGDIDEGLRILALAHARPTGETDPLIPGFERSPLADAYLAVVEALLRFWRGDVEAARELLGTASVRLPVGIPFAGLGVVLAQRLDIAVHGTPGPLARSLAATLPGGIRLDRLVDSGLSAYLGGAAEQAAIDVTLWHDRGAPEPALGIPGLDEVGPVARRPRVEPPETTRARLLLHRIRTLPESSWRREHDEIAETGRRLTSPFDRARVEALLGSTCLSRGDASAGRRHLRAASRLFEDAGALAWKDAVEARLARLTIALSAQSDPVTEPIAVIRDADPLAASRVAWETLLTEREIEVAMRVASGGENREIATALDVSVRTVEVHVGRLFDKLGVRNRVELAVLAHRTGRVF